MVSSSIFAHYKYPTRRYLETQYKSFIKKQVIMTFYQKYTILIYVDIQR